MKPKFIVAEISKSYVQLRSRDPEMINTKFERVINTNYARGYDLIDWKLGMVASDDVHNETIIAVFKLNELRKPEIEDGHVA